MSQSLICCQEATSCTSRLWILLDLWGLGSQLLILLHKSEKRMQWGEEVEPESVQGFVSAQWGVWMGIIILGVSPPSHSLSDCLTGSRVDSSRVFGQRDSGKACSMHPKQDPGHVFKWKKDPASRVLRETPAERLSTITHCTSWSINNSACVSSLTGGS